MVHFIYGPSGSGKTYTLFKYLEADVKNGKKAFFIVPEQETVAVEREIVSSLPASAQLDVEVLNFSRLCNRIFRTYGGLSYNFATKPQKALIMWNTIRELSPQFEEYTATDVNDFSLTQKMLSATQELKAYSVSPLKLENSCQKIDENSSLFGKLRDISLIYSAYTSQLSEYFSDSQDDISKVLDILKSNNFFANSNIYLDSFAGFTKQEFDLIYKMGELCDELYITLPIPSPNDNSIHLESLRQTLTKLKKPLDKSDYDETYLSENHRTSVPELQYLQNNIWNFEASAFDGENADAIKNILCETPYSEAEIIASEICREIQNGARYSEIAIILRDVEKYRGILDVALEKYGIPFFLSEKTDLMTKPLAKFIFSALKIKESNWRGANVIAHLKSGYSDVDPFDVDIFEDYVYTWNINGNKFLHENWTMNPDGYSAKMTKRGEKILVTANQVKESIVPPLSLYFTRLDASKNVKEMCQATIEFLKSSNITEKVRSGCAKHLKVGNKKAADEDMKLYSLTLNILYDLSNVFGDKEFTFEEFSAALSLMFAESDIGTIPTSADEVVIGSASMLRTGKIKTAIVMGLNEGEFPASVKDNGIFTDADKEILEAIDISLSADTNTKTSEELFFVCRAFASASKKLILTSSALSSDGTAQRQSLALERVKNLFRGTPQIKEAYISPFDKVWNTNGVKEIYSQTKNQKIKELIDDEQFENRLNVPLSQRDCSVSPEIVDKLFGKRISLTQSRLEKYVLCGFDYYCSYVLGLRESKRAVFQLNDIGTFIHYILESFMKEITVDGTLKITLTNEEIDEILKKTVSKYLFDLLGEDYALSNRTKHLFIRLNKLSFMIAKNLINEFKESDFIPSYFELKFGMGEDSINALEFTLKDGSVVTLRGIADRVDTYKKDGNVYIRIVDYKTGSKEFSFDELKEGLNTQLLIYLFSICKAQDDKTKAEFACDDGGELIPAGIQYLSSNAPIVSVDKFCEGDEIEKLIQSEFSRSGLLSSDPEILYAMNHNLDPKFISKVKTNDDGIMVGKGIVDQNGFEEIYDLLSETIINIAESMKNGKANAVPLKKGDDSPCRYCKMKSVCRASVCKSKI
ncbi:MAG: exodeoxyribonuclease V subunit gamma [Clostridia bacterium]|nr:exodeoxyribonuclease V subunit gamma [Clostridia bacterium]